jgi:hypothetical protein
MYSYVKSPKEEKLSQVHAQDFKSMIMLARASFDLSLNQTKITKFSINEEDKTSKISSIC